MKFVADIHIHSHFSRATSKKLSPEYLDFFAGLKGIKVVGTGDFTHPGWLKELKEKTYPDQTGFLRLKKEFQPDSFFGDNETRFLLTAEISNIYKKSGKVRKVHNLILVPGFDEAEKINKRLIGLGGNLTSDGRPILGLDSSDLLEIVLECSGKNYFIPAHIWTPWFSMLGSKSGFDSIEECFEDLSPHIKTIETGLSTDPPMNWLCSFLDNITLVSNSDAHSPDKLGRNANVFNTELTYFHLTEALKTGNPKQFQGTIDMFPQEGKYHYDGHRKCNICWDPAKTIKNNFTCPKCLKPVTVGVMNRVIELSDREDVFERKNRLPFRSIIPLKEILAEINGVGPGSKKVEADYQSTLKKLGSELDILLETPPEEIEKKKSKVLAEAIRRMRNREIIVQEGYDGEFGVIKVFRKGEVKNFTSPKALFQMEKPAPPKQRALIEFDLKGIHSLLEKKKQTENKAEEKKANYNTAKSRESGFDNLNAQQFEAVKYTNGPSLIVAGPGTGKTKTLTSKIAWLIANKKVRPEEILAITFTNKAAGELTERLQKLVKSSVKTKHVHVHTFHGFGLEILKTHYACFNRSEDFILLDETLKSDVIKSMSEKQKVKNRAMEISAVKSGLSEKSEFYNLYEKQLQKLNAFDLDDLIAKPLGLFNSQPEVLNKYQKKYRFIFVDEYQDTNHSQYRLLKLLAPDPNANLCVVGDENQSIYGFRGANAAYISTFSKDYPGGKIFYLKKSYRCSQTILSASANVLQSNSEFLEGLEKGVQLITSEQATDASEAEFIARQIIDLVGGVSFFSIDSSVTTGNKNDSIQSLSDFGILCRTRNQFEAIAKALTDHHIPFQKVGTKPFYQQNEFSGFNNLLSAFSRESYENASLLFTLKKVKISPVEFDFAKGKTSSLSPPEVLNFLRKNFFANLKFDELNWERYIELAGSFNTISEFIRHISMGTGTDTHNKNLEAVTLMTLHASKGLEFECVFIPGCEDGLLPYNLYNKNTDVNEEKRLLYVGMTRAKKLLYLTNAKTRIIRGRKFNLPKSPFLMNIQEELLQKITSVS